MKRTKGPRDAIAGDEQSSISRKILHGILGGTGQTAATILVSFVQIRLILGFLSRDLSGIWFLFLSIGAYIAYFDLGISPTVSREISFITAGTQAEKNSKIADLIATCQRLFQIMAAGVFVLGLILGGMFLWKIGAQAHSKDIGIAWLIFTMGASLNLLGGVAFAALYGTGNVAAERVIRAVTQLMGLAFSALALVLGFGIIGLAVAWVAQNILARLWGWKILYRFHPELKSAQGRASIAIVKKIAAPSLKWAAIGLGAILILQTDNPIIAAKIGVASIPSYEAASKIVSALMTFSLLIVTSSTPFLSQAHAAGDREAFTALLMRNLRFGMATMMILASFLAIFGDKVIGVWLGPGNYVGFPVLWTLLIMLTLEVHHVIHATATMAAGHIIFLWSAILAGIMKIAISLLLAPIYGIWGVALGTLLAQLATNNWYAPYATLRIFNISTTYYVKNFIVQFVFLGVFMLSCNAALRYCLGQVNDVSMLIIVFPSSAIIGVAITFFFVLTAAERTATAKKLHVW